MINKFKNLSKHKNKIIHGYTTKDCGEFESDIPVSTLFREAEKTLCDEINIPALVFTNQMHSDEIMVIKKRSNEIPKCDALMTNISNLPLMIKTADCQGILMYDKKNKAIAAIHSGWKGF